MLRQSFEMPLWTANLFLIALLFGFSGQAVAQTFTASPEVRIPDVTRTCVTLNVPTSVTIADLDVLLYLTHTFDSDLVITLNSPVGTSVLLANHRGGSGDNFGVSSGSPTIFDDEAGTAIAAGAAPFNGSFRPESPLSTFDGQNAQGQWQLIVDDTVGGDSGTLHFVGLRVNGNTTVTAITSGLGSGCVVGGHHIQHTTHGHTSGVQHHGEHGHSVGFQDPPHPFGHKPGLTVDPGEDRIFVAGVNQDGTINGSAATQIPGMAVRPATRGSVIQLFGSAVDLALTDGGSLPIQGNSRLLTAPAEGDRFYRTLNLPEVFIGGVQAEVLYSGLAPGLTGVWQIDVRIPEAVPQGDEVPVVIEYEGAPLSRKVAVAVQ
jgi:subtilisin-like proprotein convertase family protein